MDFLAVWLLFSPWSSRLAESIASPAGTDNDVMISAAHGWASRERDETTRAVAMYSDEGVIDLFLIIME